MQETDAEKDKGLLLEAVHGMCRISWTVRTLSAMPHNAQTLLCISHAIEQALHPPGAARAPDSRAAISCIQQDNQHRLLQDVQWPADSCSTPRPAACDCIPDAQGSLDDADAVHNHSRPCLSL